MKNFKKVIFALMVVFLVVGFIGCKTESDPPKAPVVTNNFKGNVFVAEYSVESDSGIWGYIEFIDDTNGKMGISNYDEESNPIITDRTFTYSVTDDVATLNATMDGVNFTVTTSKLTDGIFTFSTEDVDEATGETYSILITCTKGDKSLFDVWTVLYDEQEQMKDFFYEFEDYVELLVEGDDYSKDDTTKTITLTDAGWAKIQDAMGGDSEEEEGNGGSEEEGDEVTGWTVMYGENIVQTFESSEEAITFASNIGLVEDDDYTVNYETQIITLTDAGAEKVQAAMGGGSEEEGDEVTGWTVMYGENIVQTFESSEEAITFASNIGLVEDDDYTVNYETQIITLTDAGAEKVQAAMGGGSEEEGDEVTGWTVMYGENIVQTFESSEEALTYASSIGLVEDDDYIVNYETQTITLTAAGAEKVGLGGDTEGGDSGEVYYYYHDGKLIGGKNTLENFEYEVKDYDLIEGEDYTIDHENKRINFTDSGMQKGGYPELEG